MSTETPIISMSTETPIIEMKDFLAVRREIKKQHDMTDDVCKKIEERITQLWDDTIRDHPDWTTGEIEKHVNDVIITNRKATVTAHGGVKDRNAWMVFAARKESE